ncbi:MAG: YifB family Mg chelatase-like AAA ATPase [Longimicrobiales bacterium]
MLAQVNSAAVFGIDAYSVRVEVDLANGLPCMTVVGLAEGAVREGRERVTAALGNSGRPVPPRRITVNLAPADTPKSGSGFDLPIAIGILMASGALEPDAAEGSALAGELGLDGELRPLRGALSLALCCRAAGLHSLILPHANAGEAAEVDDLCVLGARTLDDVVAHLGACRPLPRAGRNPAPAPDAWGVDFSDVKGQAHVKRALEVAAAGQHNVLMVGPPGAGKSMLARRLPTILPPMARAEAVEVTRIHSVAGRLRSGHGLLQARPFRSPHHTISDAGLVGGGTFPRPGEASLAHAGVLFLDELPEFRRSALEALRQPLEDRVIHIGRARGGVSFPAAFMLVAAMNPCPCGHYGNAGSCICHASQVVRYRGRISGPLLDRIDVQVEVAALHERELIGHDCSESSSAILGRTDAARARQTQRFHAEPGIHANAQMQARQVRAYCVVDTAGETLLRTAVKRFGLSARAYHRILRLARTIADLDGDDRIGTAHVAEAIQYRTLERPYATAARG